MSDSPSERQIYLRTSSFGLYRDQNEGKKRKPQLFNALLISSSSVILIVFCGCLAFVVHLNASQKASETELPDTAEKQIVVPNLYHFEEAARIVPVNRSIKLRGHYRIPKKGLVKKLTHQETQQHLGEKLHPYEINKMIMDLTTGDSVKKLDRQRPQMPVQIMLDIFPDKRPKKTKARLGEKHSLYTSFLNSIKFPQIQQLNPFNPFNDPEYREHILKLALTLYPGRKKKRRPVYKKSADVMAPRSSKEYSFPYRFEVPPFRPMDSLEGRSSEIGKPRSQELQTERQETTIDRIPTTRTPSTKDSRTQQVHK